MTGVWGAGESSEVTIKSRGISSEGIQSALFPFAHYTHGTMKLLVSECYNIRCARTSENVNYIS